MSDATSEQMLETAIRLLVAAASPRRIILFGSRARGDAVENSDFDLLVVEERVKSSRAEMVRLLEVLEPHGIPADVFVAGEDFYASWSLVPGNLLYEARAEGRVVYEAA